MPVTTDSQVSVFERVPPELIRKILLLAADSDVEGIDLGKHDYSGSGHLQLPSKSQKRRLKPPAQQQSLVCSTWMQIVAATTECWVTTIFICLARMTNPISHHFLNGHNDFEDLLLGYKDLLKNSLGGDIDIFMRVQADPHDVEMLQQSLAPAILPYSNQIRQLVVVGPGYHYHPITLRPLIVSNQLNRLMLLSLHTRSGPSMEWPTKETTFLPRLTAVIIGNMSFNFIRGASWRAPNLRKMHISVSDGKWSWLSAFCDSDFQLHALVLRSESGTYGDPDVIPWKNIPPEAAIHLPFVTSLDLRQTRSVDFGMAIIMLGNLTCLRTLSLNSILVGALCDLEVEERIPFPQVRLLTLESLYDNRPLPDYTLGANEIAIFPNLHTLHLRGQSVSQLASVTSVVNRSQLKHLTIALGMYRRLHSPSKGSEGSTVEFSSLESVHLYGVNRQSFPFISTLLRCPVIKRLSISGPVTTDASILNYVWKKPTGRHWQNIDHFSITFDHEVQTPSLSCLSFLSRLTSLQVVLLNKDGAYKKDYRDPRRLAQDWKSNKVIRSMRALRSLRLVVEGIYCMAFLEFFLSFVRDLKIELQRLEIRSPRRPKGFDKWLQSIPEFYFDLIKSSKVPNAAS